jgi:hypothetical protein
MRAHLTLTIIEIILYRKIAHDIRLPNRMIELRPGNMRKMIIPNLTTDDRFKDNPLVKDNPSIRFCRWASPEITDRHGIERLRADPPVVIADAQCGLCGAFGSLPL